MFHSALDFQVSLTPFPAGRNGSDHYEGHANGQDEAEISNRPRVEEHNDEDYQA